MHRAGQQLTQNIAIETLFGIYDEAESQWVGKYCHHQDWKFQRVPVRGEIGRLIEFV